MAGIGSDRKAADADKHRITSYNVIVTPEAPAPAPTQLCFQF